MLEVFQMIWWLQKRYLKPPKLVKGKVKKKAPKGLFVSPTFSLMIWWSALPPLSLRWVTWKVPRLKTSLKASNVCFDYNDYFVSNKKWQYSLVLSSLASLGGDSCLAIPLNIWAVFAPRAGRFQGVPPCSVIFFFEQNRTHVVFSSGTPTTNKASKTGATEEPDPKHSWPKAWTYEPPLQQCFGWLTVWPQDERGTNVACLHRTRAQCLVWDECYCFSSTSYTIGIHRMLIALTTCHWSACFSLRFMPQYSEPAIELLRTI